MAEVKETKRKNSLTGFSLPKTIVKVKPILRNRPNAITAQNELTKFRMPGTQVTFVVPVQRNGKYVQILSDEEKEFFEDMEKSGMSFNKGDLSVYKDKSNFYETLKYSLGSDEIELDLSRGWDYIMYKLLLAQTDLISPTWEDRNKKATYLYAIVDEAKEADAEAETITMEQEAWELFGKLTASRANMTNFLKVLGKNFNEDTNDSVLKGEIRKLLTSTNGVRRFLEITKDVHYDTKLFIFEALRKGGLKQSHGRFYMADGEFIGTSIDEVVAYLDNPKNSEAYVNLKAKVDNA